MQADKARFYLEKLKPLLSPSEKRALEKAADYGLVLSNSDRQAIARLKIKIETGFYKKRGVDI